MPSNLRPSQEPRPQGRRRLPERHTITRRGEGEHLGMALDGHPPGRTPLRPHAQHHVLRADRRGSAARHEATPSKHPAHPERLRGNF